ncbi:MAG: hypothetical protein M0036_11700 [Desulfobacteraceae bacterium]|nr:hypothetical protein [Desulfobacteraceae bacterium]
MKKTVILLLVLSVIGLISYACDTGTSETPTLGASVCTKSISGIGSTSAAKLYYPCTINGTVGATTLAGGYTETLNNVDWLSQAVASAGYVVLAYTPTNTLGMVSQWRDAHKNCISKLKSLNTSDANVKGKINTSKLQVSGHSKGGGGALWAAAQLTTQLRTAVPLAPYQEQFANSALSTIKAATFIEAGGGDTLATNAMTRGEYNALPTSISRKYLEYNGYGHMAWSYATGADAARMSGDMIAWMKYYMDGDTSQKSIIANQSGTTNFNWVDKGAPSSSSSSTSSTTSSTSSTSSSSGCN